MTRDDGVLRDIGSARSRFIAKNAAAKSRIDVYPDRLAIGSSTAPSTEEPGRPRPMRNEFEVFDAHCAERGESAMVKR
jgi:hypothetical protein